MTSVQSASVASSGSLTRNERLDRLPFNKAHRKLLVASGIGWAFDAMDVGLVSFVVAAIAADPHFNLTPTEKSWVLSIGFVGMAIGAALGGFVADRVGRKTVFSATLVIFGLANGGMALSWSLTALLIARLIIGLGLGAELPVASTLVSEFSPTKQRGRMTVLLESFWAVGWIVAACIGYFVIPNTGDWGWRWALLIGALPLLYAIVTRVHIPESVRFLESKGREDEAEQAVRYFEQAGGIDQWLPRRQTTAEDQHPRTVRQKVHRAHRSHLGHVVLRELLLLWSVHMDAVAAGRPVWLADQVVRLYAGHRRRAVAGILPGRMAGGDLGPQEDAERVPCRVGRGRVCFLASGFRSCGVGLWHVVVRIQSWRVGRTVCGDSGNLSDPPARCCVRCCCGMWPSGCHHSSAAHAVVPDAVRWQQGGGIHRFRGRLHSGLRCGVVLAGTHW